jgi:retron-type reverse transcriptase
MQILTFFKLNYMKQKKYKVPPLKYILEDAYSVEFLKLKKILNKISDKSKYRKDATFKDLYSLLENPILLMQALGKISPNKGASTPGIDQETLDEMKLKKIENLATAIKNKTFYFKAVRRVLIPKPGKKKLRPLGISTFSDRIIQEAIRIILEAIYEPTFENHRFQNYGFRPDKSCHDAINYLKDKGTACNYAIEGDIKGAYDNVDHDILIKILRKKIKDEKFIQLIKQG